MVRFVYELLDNRESSIGSNYLLTHLMFPEVNRRTKDASYSNNTRKALSAMCGKQISLLSSTDESTVYGYVSSAWQWS